MYKKIGLLLLICIFHMKSVACNSLEQYYNNDALTSTEKNHPSMICLDIKPQHSVDIDQIMGLWYGSEIIMHTQDVPGVFEYDSCVIIHLTDITEQILLNQRENYDYKNTYRRTQYTTLPPASQYDNAGDHIQTRFNPQQLKYLRMVWSEKDNNLEYTFNYTNNAPGLWSNIGDQRGSLVAFNQYTQFTGTVQVVKAVSDHLVLTFCGNDIKSTIYTIVLSRNRLGLTSDEIRSIRNLLSRRGLYTDTIRKVCNGAGILMNSTGLMFALLTCLAFILRKFH